MMKHLILLMLSFCFGVEVAHASAFSPLGLSLFAPVQLPGEDFTVTGARINFIYGATHSVYGLDLGLVNETHQTMGGIQVGALNINKGETDAVGLQFGGIGNFNVNKANIYGVQAALINSNKAESLLVGVGVAAANITPFTHVVGVQVGLYNTANEVSGLQIGVVNSAQYLHGIQIGLLNFNVHGLSAIAPALNIGF